MREIVLDTETTGLDPVTGHRIVEIGCVELINHVPTGEHRQWYLNPERDMPAEAEAVHGLSAAFLADKPLFSAVAETFLAFLGNASLVIHNAEFDMKFVNAELQRCGLAPLSANQVIDTVVLARRMFLGASVSLDALCRRFSINNTSRTVHGALLDAQLLADIYFELVGGREPKLALTVSTRVAVAATVTRTSRPPRPHVVPPKELEAHKAFIAKLKSPLWRQ